ncbi:MAG: hydrogenase [Candidatus Abyssubacteria bacterium]|nr:hydrogenase [Candidatus Abyssubacteria bacterium]
MTADRGKRLLWHGVLLFLIGLLTGFAIPALTNPRLGLSAHMEALLNGMVLVLLGGVVWNYLKLSERMEKLVFWLFIYAAYANWFFCLLAAIFGANKNLPIASAGHRAAPWQEIPVNIGLGTGALSITLACVLVLYGLRSQTKEGGLETHQIS